MKPYYEDALCTIYHGDDCLLSVIDFRHGKEKARPEEGLQAKARAYRQAEEIRTTSSRMEGRFCFGEGREIARAQDLSRHRSMLAMQRRKGGAASQGWEHGKQRSEERGSSLPSLPYAHGRAAR